MKFFNINNEVWIKPTERGFQRLVEDHNTYVHRPEQKVDADYFKNKTESHGYLKMQLWEVMSIFGQYMSIGFHNFFETNIVINENELESLKKPIEQ